MRSLRLFGGGGGGRGSPRAPWPPAEAASDTHGLQASLVLHHLHPSCYGSHMNRNLRANGKSH